jgi:hypothetical protein
MIFFHESAPEAAAPRVCEFVGHAGVFAGGASAAPFEPVAGCSVAPETGGEFRHVTFAHGGSGVISSLLHFSGLPVSGALCFGLGAVFPCCPPGSAGLSPNAARRMPPGRIIDNISRRLRLPLRFERFHGRDDGRRRLDELIDAGRPVGLQADAFLIQCGPDDGLRCNVFLLHYGPACGDIRLDGHCVTIFGRNRETGDYLVSDPVIKAPVCCPAGVLLRACLGRGSRGNRGFLCHCAGPVSGAGAVCVVPSLSGVIRRNAGMLLKAPASALARTVFPREAAGGGMMLHHLHAAFLEETAALLGKPALRELARELAAIGDERLRLARESAGPAAAPRGLARKERSLFQKLLHLA